MTTLLKNNGDLFPTLVSDFFDNDFFPAYRFFDPDLRFARFGLSLRPSVNITENDNEFIIELAVPGLKKEDFKIETDHDRLTIRAEASKEEEKKNENYRRREFSYQGFSRSFDLPENSRPNDISANYEDGILKLTLPKKEKTSSKAKKNIEVA